MNLQRINQHKKPFDEIQYYTDSLCLLISPQSPDIAEMKKHSPLSSHSFMQ